MSQKMSSCNKVGLSLAVLSVGLLTGCEFNRREATDYEGFSARFPEAGLNITVVKHGGTATVAEMIAEYPNSYSVSFGYSYRRFGKIQTTHYSFPYDMGFAPTAGTSYSHPYNVPSPHFIAMNPDHCRLVKLTWMDTTGVQHTETKKLELIWASSDPLPLSTNSHTK